MSDTDSPLSSVPEDDEDTRFFDEQPSPPSKKSTKKTTKIKLKPPQAKSPTPPPKKPRKKEPPHVPTFADSPELAFIVMFRARFTDAFKGVPNLGCQDIERGIVDSTPSEQVELLLCRLISLVLNRKKPVERGHHTRALEEALHQHIPQWPRSWEGKNPLSGGRTFTDMDSSQRLVLLKALINWALVSSEAIRSTISENYKGTRREDDSNVATSVQPWGRDGDKRRYWLIEGNDDTPFRLYRESNRALKNIQWINIAGTIDELRVVANDLEEYDGSKHAMALRQKILSAIPRFEEGENKRKKREYRASRKAFFNQPSGISIYEGRTRGKRIKYTFSDAEDGTASDQDDTRSRRSARSTRNTPAPDVPRFTASGRQIRRPVTGAYGETVTNGSHVAGTATISNAASESGEVGYNHEVKPKPTYTMEDSEEEAQDSGAEEDADEWGSGSDDGEGDISISEWDDSGFDDEAAEKRSLKIILKVNKEKIPSPTTQEANHSRFENQPPPPKTTIYGNGIDKGLLNGQPNQAVKVLQPTTGARIEGRDADVEMRDAGPGAPIQNGTASANANTAANGVTTTVISQ